MFSLILFKGVKRKITFFNNDREQNPRFVKPGYAFKILLFQAKEVFLLSNLGSNLTFYDILTSWFGVGWLT